MSFYTFRDYRPGECVRCRCKRGVTTIWYVRRLDDWQAERLGATHGASSRTMCVDPAVCAARTQKRRERAQTRGSLLVVQEPEAPNAPPGTCSWCGEVITLIDHPEAYRRKSRAYHRGDRWETGGRDCRAEANRSRCWDPRVALERLAEIAGEPLRCVDCGHDVGGPGRPWDADHEVPLEDGGEHSLENLRVRCVACHKAKTAREARERARRRRGVDDDQLQLGDVA